MCIVGIQSGSFRCYSLGDIWGPKRLKPAGADLVRRIQWVFVNIMGLQGVYTVVLGLAGSVSGLLFSINMLLTDYCCLAYTYYLDIY